MALCTWQVPKTGILLKSCSSWLPVQVLGLHSQVPKRLILRQFLIEGSSWPDGIVIWWLCWATLAQPNIAGSLIEDGLVGGVHVHTRRERLFQGWVPALDGRHTPSLDDVLSHWGLHAPGRGQSRHIRVCHCHHILFFHSAHAVHVHVLLDSLLVHTVSNLLVKLHLLLIHGYLLFKSSMSLHLLLSFHSCLCHHMLVHGRHLHSLFLAILSILECPPELLLGLGLNLLYFVPLIQESLHFHIGVHEAFQLVWQLLVGLSQAGHLLF